MTANNDSSDLEALFDSIASDYSVPVQQQPTAPAPAAPQSRSSSVGDSDELQALFDSVAAENVVAEQESMPVDVSDSADAWPKQEAVFNRIGHWLS